MRFKRKIELGCVFDSVKKLSADVVRQNITNAGSLCPVVDTCWIFVPRCRHGLGLLKTKPSLGSLQPSWNLLDLKKQYTCSINERILQVQTDNWHAARILLFIMIISACTCFEKIGELGIRTAGAYATHQIKIRCLKIRFETNDSALYPRRPSAWWLEANASSYQKIVNKNTNLRTTR